MAETTLTVSSEALQRLLAAANGDAALLYLYLASDIRWRKRRRRFA